MSALGATHVYQSVGDYIIDHLLHNDRTLCWQRPYSENTDPANDPEGNNTEDVWYSDHEVDPAHVIVCRICQHEQGIYETKVEIVVYSRGPIDHNPPGRDNYGRTLLGDIIEGMTDGDLVGDWNVGESVPVPPNEVRDRLEAIGLDGDFFDDEDDDDGE